MFLLIILFKYIRKNNQQPPPISSPLYVSRPPQSKPNKYKSRPTIYKITKLNNAYYKDQYGSDMDDEFKGVFP